VTRRIPIILFAVTAAMCASIAVLACSDKTDSKGSSATAVTASSKGACTASMAAKCTPEMAAACKAKASASASNTIECPYHSSAATAATANSAGGCNHDGAAGTSAYKASAAGMGSCASKSSASGACTAHKGAAVAFEAMSMGHSSCGGKGISAMAGNLGHDCDACADMAACESQLKSAGSNFQVVPLKNGVMYVYTAGDARNVRAVQAAINRRNERINALMSADNAKLCPDCKRMRGAMASGKLTREVVNIEGGSISLVTSNDPQMVSKLYSMAGLTPGMKLVKS
jgi:hypothetical protein